VRFVVLVIAAAAACVDTPPMWEPEVESSHVQVHNFPPMSVPKLDVVVFVDDTLAMSAYRDRIAQMRRMLANALESRFGGWIDLRLAVTSNDGTFHPLPGSDASYLARSVDLSFRTWKNYDGSLEDVFTSLIGANDHSEGPNQPLEAVRRALERNSRFLREDAGLAILIISGADDASLWPVADYTTWLRAIVEGSWRRTVIVSAIYPQPAARLDELTLTPPPGFHPIATPIDSLNYSKAFESLTFAASRSGWGGGSCMETAPVDRDPLTPGDQYDCAMSAFIDDEARVVPQCFELSKADFTDQPSGSGVPTSACFSLVVDPQCWAPAGLTLQLHGYLNSVHPALRLECVMN
jgi:hypothetical protein